LLLTQLFSSREDSELDIPFSDSFSLRSVPSHPWVLPLLPPKKSPLYCR
jgi:hypothetical protein